MLLCYSAVSGHYGIHTARHSRKIPINAPSLPQSNRATEQHFGK